MRQLTLASSMHALRLPHACALIDLSMHALKFCYLSHFETATCRLAWRQYLLLIALLKIDMLKITVCLKNMKRPKTFGFARRTLPIFACLKIGIAENRNSSHVNENRLIGFYFLQGTRICARNRHPNLGTPIAKNSNCSHVIWKRLTGIVSSQTLNIWSKLRCEPLNSVS
jgi:hypothetical protein